jgi:hypothetical protein
MMDLISTRPPWMVAVLNSSTRVKAVKGQQCAAGSDGQPIATRSAWAGSSLLLPPTPSQTAKIKMIKTLQQV